MVMINMALTSDVMEFLENGDENFLIHLKMSPRDDIESQAVVRYLMQIKRWSFAPNSEFSAALDNLFAEYPGRPQRDPKEYQDTTFALIKETFDYECVFVEPEPRPAAKPNPGKVTRRPQMIKEEHSEGGAQPDAKSTKNQVDTTGASDRLKRVINIQRGS